MAKLAIVLALLSGVAHAQYQQKPGTVACRVSTYQCGLTNAGPIVMTSGDKYTFNEPYGVMIPGEPFDWDSTAGVVESIIQQPPPYLPVGTYPFSFTFSLSDGHSGTVSGWVVIVKPGRYPFASVEHSTVTFN